MTRKSTRFHRYLPSTFLALVWLMVVVGSAHGASTVASFLAIPVDAASAAAGGADVARPQDGISPFANPAAALTSRPQASLTHVEWLANQAVDVAQLRIPLSGGRGGLAFTGRIVDHASIPRFDLMGSRISSLEPRDLSVGMAYAARLGRVILGAGFQYLQEDVDISRGTGYAYDLGFLVDLGPVRLGGAGTNLLGSLDYDGESYDIPERVAFGASYRPWGMPVELNAQWDEVDLSGQAVSMGVHWTALENILVLRAGYVASDSGQRDHSFSPMRFGFQVGGLGGLAFDYAFIPHEELGQAHMVALRWTGR